MSVFAVRLCAVDATRVRLTIIFLTVNSQEKRRKSEGSLFKLNAIQAAFGIHFRMFRRRDYSIRGRVHKPTARKSLIMLCEKCASPWS